MRIRYHGHTSAICFQYILHNFLTQFLRDTKSVIFSGTTSTKQQKKIGEKKIVFILLFLDFLLFIKLNESYKFFLASERNKLIKWIWCDGMADEWLQLCISCHRGIRKDSLSWKWIDDAFNKIIVTIVKASLLQLYFCVIWCDWNLLSYWILRVFTYQETWKALNLLFRFLLASWTASVILWNGNTFSKLRLVFLQFEFCAFQRNSAVAPTCFQTVQFKINNPQPISLELNLIFLQSVFRKNSIKISSAGNRENITRKPWQTINLNMFDIQIKKIMFNPISSQIISIIHSNR